MVVNSWFFWLQITRGKLKKNFWNGVKIVLDYNHTINPNTSQFLEYKNQYFDHEHASY